MIYSTCKILFLITPISNWFWQLKIDLGQEIFQISDLIQDSVGKNLNFSSIRNWYGANFGTGHLWNNSRFNWGQVKYWTGYDETIQNLIKTCPRLNKTVPSFTKSYFKYDHNLTRICFIPVPNSTEFFSLSKFDCDLSQISNLGKFRVLILFFLPFNLEIRYLSNLSPFWAYFENLCETILGPISDNNPEIIKILPIHIFNLENPENLNSTF